jgi:excisionase family DNA binding protein
MRLSEGQQFNVTRAAQRWGVSTKSVRKLIKENKLGVLRFGRTCRIPLEEILRWEKLQLQQRQVSRHG